MKKIIPNKEYATLLVYKRFKIMGGLIAFLLLVALLGGFASYRSLKKERDLAQKEAREIWLNQGEKNPLSAAHYGSLSLEYVRDVHGVCSF